MTRSAICSLLHRFDCRALLSLPALMLIAGLFHLIVVSPAAFAGSFGINPIRVDLSSSQPSAVIHVDNHGDSEVTVEARSFIWAQADGKDQLTLTRDIIVTPQIFRIKPGATQVLRIGTLRKPDPSQEIPYRLTLEEILPPPPPDLKGVRVALRISMPVFLKPVVEAKEKIEAAISIGEGAQLKLRLANSGNASAHFSEILLFDEDKPDKLIASQIASTYVLPGQQREILLKTTAFDAAKKILIKAKTHAGPVEFHAVPVAR